jgi:hypothetical protein
MLFRRVNIVYSANRNNKKNTTTLYGQNKMFFFMFNVEVDIVTNGL